MSFPDIVRTQLISAPIPITPVYKHSELQEPDSPSDGAETNSTSSQSPRLGSHTPSPPNGSLLIVPKSQSVSPSAENSLEDSFVVKKKNEGEDFIESLYQVALTHPDLEERKRILQFIHGLKTSNFRCNFPINDLHQHLEGIFTAQELKQMAENASLYYDKDKKAFRRKKTSVKRKTPRTPASEVTLKTFEKMACLNPKKRVNDKKFHQTFTFRGSICDRAATKNTCGLAVQLLIILQRAKLQETQYQEIMYGVYDVPVPQKFKDSVNTLKKQMTKENINYCINWLLGKPVYTPEEKEELKTKLKSIFPDYTEGTIDEFINWLINNYNKETVLRTIHSSEGKEQFKIKLKSTFPTSIEGNIEEFINWFINNNKEATLRNVYTPEEKEKLKKKLKNTFPDYTDHYYERFLDLSYVDAQNLYIKDLLTMCERHIDTVISRANKSQSDPYGLKPSVSVFCAKSPRTIKLIFEVMRHKELGEFMAWFLSTCVRIQKNVTDHEELREVGWTIDGPQMEAASQENFDDQIYFGEEVHKKYSKVPGSVHCLEFPKSRSDLNPTEISKVLKLLVPEKRQIVGDNGEIIRIEKEIPGRMGHASHMEFDTADTKDTMRDEGITVEVAATTAEITTKTKVEDLPLLKYFKQGIAVAICTDDPGLIEGTTRISELIKIILAFKLGYKDIKNIMRAGVEGSFLRGESIYEVSVEQEDIEVNGVVKVISKRKYAIKPEYQELISLGYNNKDRERRLLASSEKAQIQIKLERGFLAYEEDMLKHKNQAYTENILSRKREGSITPPETRTPSVEG